MTPRVFYSPPNPPARRAAMLLIALGGLALLFGGRLVVSASTFADELADTEQKQNLEQVRQVIGDPRVFLTVVGVMVLAYAITALSLGLLARSSGQTSLILSLVLSSCVFLLLALLALVCAAAGVLSGVLFFGVLGGLHGLCAGWLIRALARPVTPPFPAAAPRVPLQEYYLPPVEPAVDANRYGPGVAR